MYQNIRNPSNLELMKILFKLLPLFIVLLHVCYALYEDQIGKFDWRQQYIGKVKFAYIDPSHSGIHKFHLATDENVLACISSRTGSVIWRQVFEKGDDGVIDILSEEDDLITVSGRGHFIRSWDPNTGVLLWETSLPTFAVKDNCDLKFYINTDQKEIVIMEINERSHVKVSIYSFTRATIKSSDLIGAPFIDASYCEFLSSQLFLCLDKKKLLLNLLPVKESGSFIVIPLKNFGIEVSKNIKKLSIFPISYQKSSEEPYFAMQVDEDIILFQVKQSGIQMKRILPKVRTITAMTIENKLVLFLFMPSHIGFNIQALDLESDTKIGSLEGNIKPNEEHGASESVFILPYVKKDQGMSYKVLLTTADHAVFLIHQHARLIWSREEALANIVSAEILDLPLSETDASIEQEFSESDSSLISMLFTRLKSQTYLFETLFHQYLTEFQHTIEDSPSVSAISLSRDTFGLHKVIVAITEPGKIFAIDNLSGQIVWSHYEKDLQPFSLSSELHFPVFVQRTTAHFPFPPQCTIIGRHKHSGKSYLLSFNPITGDIIDTIVLKYKVIQAFTIGIIDNQYLRGIILLDSNFGIHVYPESSYVVLEEYKDTHFIVTAEKSSGALIGYALDISENHNFIAKEAWKINFPNNIISLALKRPFEHVHSQGRVMGDRSVLYKYINPNLATVITEGFDNTQKSFCNIHLVDTITGLIVYSATHKKCKSPVKVVHSENWVVYSYYNDKSRRIEISSIELFEGMSQSNTTAFSSFSPPPLPLVEHQTFIFPSPIEAMIDTVTERGLTNKHILIALPTGGILELPKAFLDPRRPINPTPEHREEGLIPYIPELPIMADKIINYNQSVMRVRGIQTAASSLESTCLVFIYGLDLFYSRVTPSKTFDILKDDFDHFLISAVLLGFLLLAYTTKKLAARKTLKTAWK